MKPFLSAQEIIILTEAHRAAQNKRQADRIKTILSLNQGYSYEHIAKILLLDDSTLRIYYQEFQSGGLDALIEDHYDGKDSLLSQAQLTELDQHLQTHTYQAAKEVRNHIKNRYGIDYTLEGVTKLLHRLGFAYKKTKRVPVKANQAAQVDFIERYHRLKASKQPQDRIYFVDAVHPVHNSEPAYGWIKKGEVKELPANTGRERLNLNGALNLEDLEVTVMNQITINAQAMIALCQELEDKQPVGFIYLILDNARYNHAKLLKAYTEQSQRIRLIFLPSYSPNLNVIERLWLLLHQKVLQNQYYVDFLRFKSACLGFFDRLKDEYHDELRSRLTDNFQIIGTS